MIRVGITGTRFGMSEAQRDNVSHILQAMHSKMGIESVVHGDCIGVDAEMHDMAVSMGIPTWICPPSASEVRAYKKGNIVYKEEGYLARDRHIVELCDTLIGIPQLNKETYRSGTWYTVRYGLKMGKDVGVVLPDGTLIANSYINDCLRPGKWGD